MPFIQTDSVVERCRIQRIVRYTGTMFGGSYVYLDSGSYTPIAHKVYKRMQEVLKLQQGTKIANPIAVHTAGRAAKKIVDDAAVAIGYGLGVSAENVFFTSGATEANDLIIRIAMSTAISKGIDTSTAQVVVNSTEHESVIRTARSCAHMFGSKVCFVEPDSNGYIQPEALRRVLNDKTVCVSIQYVNSETGVVQPITKLTEVCRNYNSNIIFHTDAAQAGIYYPYTLSGLHVDAITLDGTKVFGPQGIGVLAFQKHTQYTGKSGESVGWDKRPGTPSVALIAGLSVAFTHGHKNRKVLVKRLQEKRWQLVETLASVTPDAMVSGTKRRVAEVRQNHLQNIAPHILAISFPHVNHEYLLTLLDQEGYAVSGWSACARKDIHYKKAESIRVSILPTTTKQHIRGFGKALIRVLPLAQKGTI